MVGSDGIKRTETGGGPWLPPVPAPWFEDARDSIRTTTGMEMAGPRTRCRFSTLATTFRCASPRSGWSGCVMLQEESRWHRLFQAFFFPRLAPAARCAGAVHFHVLS